MLSLRLLRLICPILELESITRAGIWHNACKYSNELSASINDWRDSMAEELRVELTLTGLLSTRWKDILS